MISIQFWTTQAYIDFVAELFKQRLKPYIGQMHLPENAGSIVAAINDEWGKINQQFRDNIPNHAKIQVSLPVAPAPEYIELHLVI